MKKLFGLLGLVMTLVVTGCNGVTSNKNVIKFQFLKAGLGLEVYEKLAKAYEAEHPGVTVKLIPNYDVNADVDKHLTTGNCSDIYSIRDISAIKRYYIKKQIIDLKDVFDSEIEEGKTLKSMLIDSALNYAEYNGAYICIPECINFNGYVYNKKLFREKGWEVPTTTEEMKTLMDKILTDTAGKVYPLTTCSAADGYFYYLLDGINDGYEGLANLEDIYKFDTPEIWNPANRTGKRYALQTMRDWYLADNGYVPRGALGNDYIDAQKDVVNGKVAMMLNGSWFENEMSPYLKPDSELGMFKIPEYSEGGTIRHAPGYTTEDNKSVIGCEFLASYIIPTKGKNREGAIDFLKFISRTDMCELYTKTCNSVRPFKYNLDSSTETYKDMSSFGKSVLDIAKNNAAFVEYSKSQMVVAEGLSFWPAADGDPYHIKAMLQNGASIDDRLNVEYQAAKRKFGV